jgi:hypothetical protein
MKFFKPEDFEKVMNYGRGKETTLSQILSELSDAANAKLEREGKVVYGILADGKDTMWDENTHQYKTGKALLINIEPIESKKPSYEDLEQKIKNLENLLDRKQKTIERLVK